jgi:hypothetical protein
MKKTALACVAASIILAGIGGCYYIPTGYNGTARANITARDIPANIAAIALIVTGPGMLPIQQTYPPSVESIDLDVLAGPDRTFTLLLTTPSATLKAEATVDLKAGEIRDILFTPKLGGTDIVIPDGYNSRIVQISDMTGAGWIEKNHMDFGLGPLYGYAFQPWDIDFDDQGRIYIANNGGDYVGFPGVIRIDDIGHATSTDMVWVDPNLGMVTLAVDRVNGYIYYTPGYSTLYRKNINSPTIATDIPESFDLNADMPNFGTNGIAVDGGGYVYIVNEFMNNVVKYDPQRPAGSRIVASSSSVEVPWDVTVKDGMVLVSDPGASCIDIFDKDLNYINSYDGPVADPFVGPRRFLGALGMPGIYITDENNSTKERVIYMQDISGAGWVPYGTHGSGLGQFEFFTVP